jgi:hypothetical protein
VISFTVSGSSGRLEAFLNSMSKVQSKILSTLDQYGQQGVAALALATPIETGRAAFSWGYEVEVQNGVYSITWTNSDVENGFPVAVMLQYGYGTGTGGYVRGRNYINPAIKPVMDKIAEEVWKVVTSQ